MKKLITALAVITALALTGCAPTPDLARQGGHREYSKQATHPEQHSQGSLESIALDVLRKQEPAFEYASVDDINYAADSVCELFDAGGSFELAVGIAVDSGLTSGEAGAVIGYAITVRCPEHVNIAN